MMRFARYSGLRDQRKGPVVTSATAGCDGSMFVPAARMVRAPQAMSAAPPSTKTIPTMRDGSAGNSCRGTNQCHTRPNTSAPTTRSGGNAMTPAVTVFRSAIEVSGRRGLGGALGGAGGADDGVDAALDIVIRGRPRGYTDAHRGPAVPDGAAAPARAVRLDRGDHPRGALGVAEADQHLIKHDVGENLEAGLLERGGEPPRVPAGSVDELGDAALA